MNIQELLQLGHQCGYEVNVFSWSGPHGKQDWNMVWNRSAGAATLQIKHAAPTLDELAETFPLPPDAEETLRPTRGTTGLKQLGRSS